MGENIVWGGQVRLRRMSDATRWGGQEAEEVGKMSGRSHVFCFFLIQVR